MSDYDEMAERRQNLVVAISIAIIVTAFLWWAYVPSAVDPTPKQANRVLLEVDAPEGVRCFVLPTRSGTISSEGLTCVPVCGGAR